MLGCAVASFYVSGLLVDLSLIQMPGHNDIRVELEACSAWTLVPQLEPEWAAEVAGQ